MAGMDLSLRRADRGISVFWLILAMGAGVFALLAILLLAGEAREEGTYSEEPVITVQEGETNVSGNPTTAVQAAGDADGDDAAAMTNGLVADEAPTEEGDLSVEDVEVEVEPATPAAELEPEAGATVIDDGAIDEEPGERAGEAIGDNELVVDPDGTTAPVVPTDSGPEGPDDDPLTQD